MIDVRPSAGIRLRELRNPDIVRPQNRGRIVALLLHHRYLMGDRRRVNLPLVGFKPDPIIVRSDSQGGNAIQESSIGSICSVNSEPTWRLFSMTREDIVGSPAERAVIIKPPSRRVWPEARAPPAVILSLITRQAINSDFDVTVELSMKAPMSVSKPEDPG